jgi:hypothetical protein
VEEVLVGHQVVPDSNSSLVTLPFAITTCFGANLSMVDNIKALKEYKYYDDLGKRPCTFKPRSSELTPYTMLHYHGRWHLLKPQTEFKV